MTCDDLRAEPSCEQRREDVCFERGKAIAAAGPLAGSERVHAKATGTSPAARAPRPEYLDGIEVKDLLDRGGAQNPGLVAQILEQVCSALAEAHGVGLSHRDIKPANVLLCEGGGVLRFAKVVHYRPRPEGIFVLGRLTLFAKRELEPARLRSALAGIVLSVREIEARSSA